MNFADRLLDAIDEKGTPALVGLDPRVESFPAGLRPGDPNDRDACAEALERYCAGVIAAVAPLVPAVKPNIAFFEAYGWQGVRAFERTVKCAQDAGLLVIADAKRGDIGSTAKAYARSIFEVMGADAVTLSPWLGADSLAPFFEYSKDGKGTFLLVKTSNPSSADLQDRELTTGTVYGAAAELVRRWGEPFVGERGYSSVGAVVGATVPDLAATLRGLMPAAPLLLPGYGAQGGKAEALRRAFDPEGSGAIVNSSRGIIQAYRAEPGATEFGEARWTEAVSAAAVAMRKDLAGAVPGARWAKE